MADRQTISGGTDEARGGELSSWRLRLERHALPLFAALLLVFTLGQIVRGIRLQMPVFDDFCRMGSMPSSEFVPVEKIAGRWEAWSWAYWHWAGRWAANAVEFLLEPGLDPFGGYAPLVIALNVLLVVAVLAWAVDLLGWRAGLGMGALVLGVFWGSTPAPAEVVMSLVFVVEAQLGLALGLVVAIGARRGGTVGKAMALVAALTCAGIHEVAGAMLAGGLTVWLAAVWHDREKRRWALVLWSAGMVGLMGNLLAPGNAVRSHYLGTSPALKARLVALVVQPLQMVREWTLEAPRLWLAVAALLMSPQVGRASRERFTASSGAWIAAGWILMLAAGMGGPTLLLGGEMPARTQAQSYFVFCAGFLLLAVWASGQYGPALALPETMRRRLAHVLLVLCCASIALEGNTRILSRELRQGTLARWSGEQRRRIELLQQARASAASQAALPAYSDPLPYFAPNMRNSRDPRYAHNLCMEWYSGVADVWTELPATPIIRENR